MKLILLFIFFATKLSAQDSLKISGIEAPLPSFSKKFTVEDVQASTDKNDPSTIKINIKGEAKNVSFPIKLPFKAEATNPSNTNPLSQAELSAAVAIEDKDGGVYEVDDKGKTRKIGNKGSELPPIEYKEAARKMNVRLGRATTPKLLFKALASEPLAFDEWQENFKGKSIIEKEYQKIGENYYVPIKLIPAGMTGKVQVDLNGINKDSLIFKTPNGSVYTLQENNILSIAGAKNGDGIELYAQNKFDSTTIYGKLNIYGYEIKNLKVNLVPVNNNNDDDENFFKNMKAELNKIQNELNRIYYSYGVNIELDMLPAFPTAKLWDLNKDNILNTGDGKFLSRYTDEMSELNYLYQTITLQYFDANTLYLFLFNKSHSSDTTLLGDMPIKSQFGYLFGNINAQTIAHELGHGFFQLTHTFEDNIKLSKASTDNLMDYNNGTKLYKFQWDLVHDKGLKLFSFIQDSNSRKRIIADNCFKNSIYYPVYQNLLRNNNTYRNEILKKIDNNKELDLILSYDSLLFNPTKKNYDLGLTTNKNIKFDWQLVKTTNATSSPKNKIEGFKQVFTWELKTEGKINSYYDDIININNKQFILNEIGMALVLIHEAIHAMMFEKNETDDDKHNKYTIKYQPLIFKALNEYVQENKLNYLREDIEYISMSGLIFSNYFNNIFIPKKKKEWQAENELQIQNKKVQIENLSNELNKYSKQLESQTSIKILDELGDKITKGIVKIQELKNKLSTLQEQQNKLMKESNNNEETEKLFNTKVWDLIYEK